MVNDELRFEISVTDLNTLEKIVTWQNQTRGSGFEIIKETKNELNLATIKVSKHKISEIFYLGYGLSVIQHEWFKR